MRRASASGPYRASVKGGMIEPVMGSERSTPLTTGGGLVISGGCSIANGATDYVDNLRVGNASVDLRLQRYPDDVGVTILRRSGKLQLATLR